MVATLALVAAIQARDEPIEILIESKARRVVDCHAMPLTVETGGAIGLHYLRQGQGCLARLSGSEFWRTLLTKSVPAKRNIQFEVIRFDLELDDGRQIAIDRDGRMAVLPKGTDNVIGWKGPVRELTERQREQLVEISKRQLAEP